MNILKGKCMKEISIWRKRDVRMMTKTWQPTIWITNTNTVDFEMPYCMQYGSQNDNSHKQVDFWKSIKKLFPTKLKLKDLQYWKKDT